MVANKLNEVAGKGWAWYSYGGNPASSGSSSTTQSSSSSSVPSVNVNEHNIQFPASLSTSAASSSSSSSSVGINDGDHDTNKSTQSSSYYQYASDAAESTYSFLTSYLPSSSSSSSSSSSGSSPMIGGDHHSVNSSTVNSGGAGGGGGGASSSNSSSAGGGSSTHRRRSSLSLLRQGQVDPSTLILSPSLYKMIYNPYIRVRGGRQNRAKQPQSMEAVRNLIYATTEHQQMQQQQQQQQQQVPDSFQTTTSISEDESEDHVMGTVASPLNRHTRRRTSSSGGGAAGNFASFGRSPRIEEERSTGEGDNDDRLDGAPTIPPFHLQQQKLDVGKGSAGSTAGTYNDNTSPMKKKPTIVTTEHSEEQKLSTNEHGPATTEEKLDHSEQNAQRIQQETRPTNPNAKRIQEQNLSSPEETASQLAEGTLRAFRDLALDEAVELHSSLQYWTERWERPLLSWLEAGPWVWFGASHGTTGRNMQSIWYEVRHVGDGYNHQQVGQKVSQIQAVLARRLSTIGELQQHLLRAGWQRGVAQWGFLGEGGEWAQVPHTDGRMASHPSSDGRGYGRRYHYDHQQDNQSQQDDPRRSDYFFDDTIPDDIQPSLSESFDPSISRLKEPYSLRRMTSEPNVLVHHTPVRHELPSPAPTSSISRLPGNRTSRQQLNQLYYTNLFVKKKDGGDIVRDDNALADWSVDAIALIRSQLYRAANGQLILPYSQNWSHSGMDGETQTDSAGRPEDATYSAADISESADTVGPPEPASHTSGAHTCTNLPAWATLRTSRHVQNIIRRSKDVEFENEDPFEGLRLEDPFEDKADRPTDPPRIQKVTSTNAEPSRTQVSISDLPLLVDEVSGLLDCMEDVMAIQRSRRLDRLKPPSWLRQNWYAIALAVPSLSYLWRRMVSDGYGGAMLKYVSRQIMKVVREHVIEPCTEMYNELAKGTENVSDRAARDTAIATLKKMIRSWLDESYPEMPVEERIALTEAMDISLLEDTKEKSLNSIYELNNVIRMSFIEAQFIKKEMMNALVALDEMRISQNFNMNLAAVTPVVLVAITIKRVSQFIFYSTLKWGKSREETYSSFLHTLTEIERLLIHRSTADGNDTFLDSDDLGMLMLHLHELRTLLWKERRRFSTSIIRSVNEDLAELSGERGVVSVRQQLLIVERMARTYGFLKQASSQNYGQ